LLAALLLLATGNTAAASDYSPAGLYDVEYLTLPNGLRVLLKPRGEARNVAIRLVVDVGFHDFPCGLKETPHFLEHLLFSGTSRHSESQLDDLIEAHGGSWNATTNVHTTVYDVDIYNLYAGLALDTLFEIITDAQIPADKVQTVRDVIHRESGGKPSRFRRWLYSRGIGRSAADKAIGILLPESGISCPVLETTDAISRVDILRAFERWYVPGAMTLVLAGAFERDEMLARIAETFGSLQPRALPRRGASTASALEVPARVSGTFNPVLGSEGQVEIAFRTDGYRSPDYYALTVLEEYLNARLYERLRTELGLAYAPEAMQMNFEDYGVFYASGDVDLDAQDAALAAMEDELHRLRAEPLDAASVDQTRRKILMRRVKGYEANADIADYYVSSLYELSQEGRLVNYEDRIEQITPLDLHRVAMRYLAPERAVVIRDAPTLTYTRFIVIAVATLLMAAWVALRAVRRLHRHAGRRRHPADAQQARR
jgi:predicted Zn-dependent peptidase